MLRGKSREVDYLGYLESKMRNSRAEQPREIGRFRRHQVAAMPIEPVGEAELGRLEAAAPVHLRGWIVAVHVQLGKGRLLREPRPPGHHRLRPYLLLRLIKSWHRHRRRHPMRLEATLCRKACQRWSR